MPDTHPAQTEGDAATRPALVLLNFGGPRHLGEVGDFLFEILRDPNTIQLPFPPVFQNMLARRIARRRAPEVARQYAEIGGKSPIVDATQAIADALLTNLREQPPGQGLKPGVGGIPPLYIIHRYLPGHAREVARRMVADGVTHALALPLYPHFSYATTGSSLEQMRGELLRAGWDGELRALRSYPDAPGLLDAMQARLEDTLAGVTAGPEHTVVLCTAHGLPQSYVEAGDPYRLELYRTVEALRGRFPQWRFDLSFQSRVGPAEWLRPYTDEYIGTLAAQGVRDLVFFPLAFVNDHIETLYEVQVTYFGMAREAGMTPHCVQAVEDHPGHIAVLAGYARAWLAGHAGVPAKELLPPSQYWPRHGRWAWWSFWLLLWAWALFVW